MQQKSSIQSSSVFVGEDQPFSFIYDGKSSSELLQGWISTSKTKTVDASRREITTTWTDPAGGLRVTLVQTRFTDFRAADWLLYFENTGTTDTRIIESVKAADVTLEPADPARFSVHTISGGVNDTTMFTPTTTDIADGGSLSIGAGCGRSSTLNTPFFKIEMGNESVLGALEWSGNWAAQFECKGSKLHFTAGMEKTHFLLHPGEKVRAPRILLFDYVGDTLESNAQFRELIYKHYAAERSGKAPLPIPFCNTCFTRGGGWLNECNAENQISLIEAYSKLGLEALLTDAGWFTGGWPNGAGNWDARKDAYPNGMGPVAAAAKQCGMIYGLWFEPERVVKGTTVQREHPEWCLRSKEDETTFLLNLGLPEVQDYFFNIVKGFMDLPGFGVYRQDFNTDSLAYWRYNDAPDRQGITEMKYVEGLYAYWDRIHSTWPDCLMEECCSGGHRIDLGTAMRMHIHQKSDHWFDDETDQASLWSLSQYLPNNVIVAHLNNLDDYSFNSTMASSLCLGWIADDPKFDSARGKKLLDRYNSVRHLLIGAWYPLLPYPSAGNSGWVASQYHRPDLDEGMILAFRRAGSSETTVSVILHGLNAKTDYELRNEQTGTVTRAKGADLAKGLELTLPEKRSSDLIVYKKVK